MHLLGIKSKGVPLSSKKLLSPQLKKISQRFKSNINDLIENLIKERETQSQFSGENPTIVKSKETLNKCFLKMLTEPIKEGRYIHIKEISHFNLSHVTVNSRNICFSSLTSESQEQNYTIIRSKNFAHKCLLNMNAEETKERLIHTL